MIDIKDRICDVVADKVMSAEAAAEFVKDGDNLGVSGFTPSGYPKAVPLALAEKGKKLLSKLTFGLAHLLVLKSTKQWLKLASLTVVCLTRPTAPCVKLSMLVK